MAARALSLPPNYTILYHTIPYYTNTMPYHTIPIPCYTIPHLGITTLYYTIPCHIILTIMLLLAGSRLDNGHATKCHMPNAFHTFGPSVLSVNIYMQIRSPPCFGISPFDFSLPLVPARTCLFIIISSQYSTCSSKPRFDRMVGNQRVVEKGWICLKPQSHSLVPTETSSDVIILLLLRSCISDGWPRRFPNDELA